MNGETTNALAVLVIGLLGLSCTHHFELRYTTQGFPDLLSTAQIVAVVWIKPGSVLPVGGSVDFPSIYAAPVQLYKVHVMIETVLKGDIFPGDNDFYYFTTSSSGGKYLGFYGTIPYRRLVLLRREHSKLRTSTDINFNCMLNVESGYHLNFAPKHDHTIAQAIIDLLLSRGADGTDKGMVRAIFSRTRPERISFVYAAQAWPQPRPRSSESQPV